MTFEEWWATLETREQRRADNRLVKEAFETGAASRDAEVCHLHQQITATEAENAEIHELSQENSNLVAILAKRKAEIAELMETLGTLVKACEDEGVHGMGGLIAKCKTLAKVRKP